MTTTEQLEHCSQFCD